MKINEYPSISELENDDKFIIQTGGGTKKTSIGDLSKYIQSFDVEEGMSTDQIVSRHRNTFRGKNLGTSFTDEQLESIQNGTFKDLYVGDYWVYQNNNWRIADIDYFINIGYPNKLTNHHLIVIPDSCLYTVKFLENAGDYANGYANSYIRKTGLTQAKNLFKTLFNDHLVEHTDMFDTGINNSTGITATAWLTSSVEIISPYQIGNVVNPVLDISGNPADSRFRPFALFFFMNFKFIGSDMDYWLSNINKNASCGRISNSGSFVNNTNSTLPNGVRPYALIG